ncbi:MAG: hypothetical protein AAGH68_04760 [Pseudomonadota bacterium]
MILFLTRSNLMTPGALDVEKVPKRFLSLGRRLYPRSMRSKLFWRTLFEMPAARYTIALAPFPVVLFFKPEWALPISLAPVPMAMFVMMLEAHLLSVTSPTARRALVSADVADRGLDTLKARAVAALTQLVAARETEGGTYHLVIEQSALLRITPLTHVSLQQEGPRPRIANLTEEEQAMLAETLFDEAFDEHELRQINVAQDKMIRSFDLDARGVSAHARLAALANVKG